ncbi:hypothetical protein [Thermoflavimicrobium dichotomicum]|uniref:Uncharacterized protein n=1 Tax=Thermoflavimicrobium dichotomicum TaxID=46223 RepID=A0A1I3P8U8_9BACL|nr:hypothetical protein [Thermoflavimicrobium dichotomicum]SFJ17770.1 hypothetical protein SAMN05421852_105134 [Thermoflavimicrobium dichotomicum]
MNRKFLYKKPWIPGVIDDSDNNDLSWMEEWDDSPDLLKRKFTESSLDELMIELVDIFKEGNPGYTTLAGLFGFGFKFDEEKKIFSIREVERTNKDIIRVEMHLDAQSYIIRHLNIYVQKMPPLQLLKNKLNEFHKDIAFQETNNGFVIAERECVIAILKDKEVINSL